MMSRSIRDSYDEALARYSPELLAEIAQNLAKGSRAKKPAEPADVIAKTVGNEKAVRKVMEKLGAAERRALSVLRRLPPITWRWDHAVRLLETAGVPSAYTVLQELLSLGLCYMRRRSDADPLVRFDVVTGAPAESLPLVGLAAPLYELPLDWDPIPGPLEPVTPAGSWRHVDGWEWPMRLAMLWRTAQLAPIKRTQQRQLFKRDRERLVADPLLASETLDALVRLPEPGMLIYQLAMEQGWLDPSSDEQSPTAPLNELWPADVADLLVDCARGLVVLDGWCELGEQTPPGSFASDMVATRLLILLWLSELPAEQGATIDSIADALLAGMPPWNGVGELVQVLRIPKERDRLCREWLPVFLLGTLYQTGIIEVADSGTRPVVRLTSIGRRFLGQAETLPERAHFPQALIVQPNHQVIVYRQALSVPLLVHMMQIAEPRSAGAALTFEITPASVYHGLEAGLSTEGMIDILREHAGRPIPPGVEESIRTWSQKRERVSIYQDASLFEFANNEDLQAALERGLVGTPVTDRIVLVENSQGAYANLRITASRDYRLEPQPCVATGADGITLTVDLEKSDLMLESEIRRLADPLGPTDRLGKLHFMITPASIDRAFDQGLRHEFFEQWFRLRTGKEMPDSVRLLLRAAGGLQLDARTVVVVSVESPQIADGLMQHPRTGPLFHERLGPTALTVEADRLVELRRALDELGISLPLPPQLHGPSDSHIPA